VKSVSGYREFRLGAQHRFRAFSTRFRQSDSAGRDRRERFAQASAPAL